MAGIKKKILFLFIAAVLTIGGILFVSSFVSAQEIDLGLSYGQATGLGDQDIRVTIAKVIRIILSFLGIIALSIMVYGGYIYMTAGGNEEKISQAKKILINGVIGLMIILSAFSIVQFIINKLSEATGLGQETSQLCQDPKYAADHLKECFPEWNCANDPVLCCLEEMKAGGQFVAQTITPKTMDTKMNNVAARAIFNQPINQQFTANQVFKVFQKNVDISDEFDYKFLTNKDGDNYGVEASYKPEKGLCVDGTTACLKNDQYKITVNADLTSQSGKKVFTGTEKCPFPLEADFNIKNEKQWVLSFDGVDDAVSASNPLSNGSNTIESWFYPTNKTGGMIVSAGPRLYYIRMTDNGALHFRLSGIPEQNPDKSFNWCDAYSANNVVELNKWQHVVATFDNATKNGYIYLDGKKVGEVPNNKKFNGCGVVSGPGAKLGIGGLYAPSLKKWTYNLSGQIASACVYNSVLSEESVKDHFSAGVGSCGRVGEVGLQGGWYLDDWMQKEVLDYSGKKNNGAILGGAEWVLATAKSSFSSKDTVSPQVSPFKFNEQEKPEKVFSGKLYTISSSIADNSGVGYGRLEIKRSGVNGEEMVDVDYFNGPAVIQGSDATAEKPFIYNYPWVPQKIADKPSLYVVTLTVWDIDHNKTTVSVEILVVPDQCFNGKQDEGETGVDVGGPCGGLPGDDCQADWECDTGKCVDNQCVAQPKITDIYPMDGAEGNYVTILGKYFGKEKGKVEFSWDDQKTWILAELVDCGGEATWNDTWIIVKVPLDKDFPIGKKAAIKVERADSSPLKPLLDYSNDNFGPKPGGDGLFTKTNIKRPGLCSVKVDANQSVKEGSTAAPVKTKLVAKGSGLGNGDLSEIKFGGVLDNKTKQLTGGLSAPTTGWSDKEIKTQVPNNSSLGVLAVYVKVKGESSNGVPFKVLKTDSVDLSVPVIDQIDPPVSTPRSYITIYGKGFGSMAGWVFLANSPDAVAKCALKNGGDGCVPLNLSLPQKCGNTWTDTQVIAEVPADALAGGYYLILKKGDETGFSSDGQDVFEIKAGRPLPGICKLEPNYGPAPLPDGIFLNFYGVNFVTVPNVAKIYFWKKGADSQDVKTWLASTNEDLQEVKEDLIISGIPVEDDGATMQTGPIKIGMDLEGEISLSNSVKYEVVDCREATEKQIELMKKSNYRCCEADGADAGFWKLENQICIGETRSAGYVWRFTTGKLHQFPQVVEMCNEVDWSKKGVEIDYPSPVPSTLWTKGREACLNATIAVRFTAPIGISSISKETVRVYTCGEDKDGKPDCSKAKQVDAEKLNLGLLTGSKILEIMKSEENQPYLEKNTWYHVELSENIESSDCGEKNALAVCYIDKLQKTKPCRDGTAYCFDFKTGDELCTLKNASIAPPEYEVNYLGLILDPAFPVLINGIHPFYYYVWGRGSQECTILNVDGMGWSWTSSIIEKAIASVAKSTKDEKVKYTDSRATVEALQEAPTPDGVEIQASLDSIPIINQNNVLKELNDWNPLVITSFVNSAKEKDHIIGEDFANFDKYKITVGYGLDKLPTSTVGFVESSLNQKKYWEKYRYIYEKIFQSHFYLVERVYEDSSREIYFSFADFQDGLIIEDKQIYKKGNNEWQEGKYEVVKEKDGQLNIYFNGSLLDNQSVGMPMLKGPKGDLSAKVSVGASNNDMGAEESLFRGVINEFSIGVGGSVSEPIKATSTLFINLFPPTVVKFWPNCVEACINTGVGVKFSRQMYQNSYSGNISVYKCLDGETCKSTEKINWTFDTAGSDNFFLKALPSGNTPNLATSTWYRVVVKGGQDGVQALGSLKPEKPGKFMENDFVWKFRTKSDDTPCVISKVSIIPNPFIAFLIGQKTKYSAVPLSSPDACSAEGQELNPWLYGWKWSSSEPKVAEITNFSAVQKGSSFCGLDCKLLGSDVGLKDDAPYLCGNKKVDPGEDCDIGAPGEEAGVSCSFNCLRPGNLKFSTTTKEAGYCGNGDLEIAYGEECDVGDLENGKYCNLDCTNSGSPSTKSVVEHAPLCGSGEVTSGEDCDISIPLSTAKKPNQSGIGCSPKCLHVGTVLSQEWCDKHDGAKISECQKALSVCGNGVVESGEECERGKEITADYCTEKCLLKNICSISNKTLTDNGLDVGLKCQSGVDGCKDDCTWVGSSLVHKTPSLCGDGVVGIGEYGGCESEATKNIVGENPSQVATAIGKGVVDGLTKSQNTDITASAVAFLKNAATSEKISQSKTGVGKYKLQCGNTELKNPLSIPFGDHQYKYKYNDCPGDDLTKYGVAEDSCCRERAYRRGEYPVAKSAGVCRNTFISVDFVNHVIDENSLPGNLVIAIGHSEPDYSCGSGEIDVSSELKQMDLNYVARDNKEHGFWQGLWMKFKTFFARLLGRDVMAENKDVAVWCSGKIKAVPKISYQWNDDKSIVTSTVALYIDQLFPEDATVGIFMRGGNDGVRDSVGVGIKNPDDNKPMLDDFWKFFIGKDVCKLQNISVKPESYLFDKPLATSTFQAITETTNGQQIVPIKGQYNWLWDWQSQEDSIFEIPAKGSSSLNDNIIISARSVEGSSVAVASARVIEDVDIDHNQIGQIFTGVTGLQAMFCENPWPPKKFFPFEEGISYGKTVNTSGFNEFGDFDGSALQKVANEYFNFKVSYCADAGKSGDTVDDLPYLKPKLFLSSEFSKGGLEICNNGIDDDGDANIDCLDSDCDGKPDQYGGICCKTSGSAVCGIGGLFCDGDGNSQTYRCVECEDVVGSNDCESLQGKAGHVCDRGVCVKEDCDNGQDDDGDGKIDCDQAECKARIGLCGNIPKAADLSLGSDVLKRFILFNTQNDDVVGIQIFKNERRFTAAEWLKEKFGSVANVKTASVDGYDAVSDGKNYYINALNEASKDKKIYNNIYQFSINKNAQQDTQKVFKQLIDSLKFNINISNFGFCLNELVVDPLPFNSSVQEQYTKQKCITDFDCRDSFGVPKSGTNGFCSNGKTKFLRDWSRLPMYRQAQENFNAYYQKNGALPNLASGTFIPGYTVSMWPSWGKLGSLVGNLPTEKINKWVGCDPKADQQTCWNAASSTFSCPAFASVLEYEFVTTTKSYLLHAPLEYFAPNSAVVSDFILWPENFTTARGCTPGSVYSPFGEKCGDGVVNMGEACDPPGNIVVSERGYIPAKFGQCADSYKDAVKTSKQCGVDVDCGYRFYRTKDITTLYSDKPKICVYKNDLIYDALNSTMKKKYVFGCTKDSDCQTKKEYSDRICDNNKDCGIFVAFHGETLAIGTNKFNTWISEPTENFACVQPKDLPNGWDLFSNVSCSGASPASFGKCGEFEQANKVCHSGCDWSYGSCKPLYVCGNGKVEGNEVCDDGTLNGTYGHCAKDCNGQFGQFCGNGVRDEKDGKLLELCDVNGLIFQKGFCDQFPIKCDDSCVFPKDSVGPLETVIKDYCKFENGVYDCGQCVSKDEPTYDFVKENSCSWDCQGHGGYCGDKIVQSEYETCDDGNKVDFDGCGVLCQKENVACLNSDPQYYIKKINNQNYTYFYITKLSQNALTAIINGQLTNIGEKDIEQCFKQTNGNQICLAAGLKCEQVDKITSTESIALIDCKTDLSGMYDDALPTKGVFRVKCNGEYEKSQVPPPEDVALGDNVCGNGKKETYQDGTKEACDMGDKNGIKCDTTYGKSCTYCSVDCANILTVDPILFCGNKVIDIISDNPVIKEKCEEIEKEVWGLPDSGPQEKKSCPDKGNYSCQNSCMELVSNCVACGNKKLADGGAIPKIAIVNPMIGNGIAWPDDGYVALYRTDLSKFKNPWLGYTKLYLSKDTYGDNKMEDPTQFHNLFIDNFYAPNMTTGTESNILCAEEYGLHFNYKELAKAKGLNWTSSQNFDNDWEKIKDLGDIFDYPVNGEKEEIKNTVIMSPAVPKGVFRVVLRWTDKEGSAEFSSVLYNSYFTELKEKTGIVNYTDYTGPRCIKMSQQLIDGDKDGNKENYWWPSCKSADPQNEEGVYVHDTILSEGQKTQAMTIWTRDDSQHRPFAFFVDAVGESIYKYRNNNLQVEVYTYHEGQSPLWSVYKPDPENVFKISDAAGTTTNQSAEYWHVFNLIYNSETKEYEVKGVKKISTGFCEMQADIPGEQCIKT